MDFTVDWPGGSSDSGANPRCRSVFRIRQCVIKQSALGNHAQTGLNPPMRSHVLSSLPGH